MTAGHPAARPTSLQAKPDRHPVPQEFVLLPATTGRAGRPLDNRTADHDLLGTKLPPSQIHLNSRAELIPPVMTGLLAADADLAEHQLPAEKILDHQSRHPALAPRRVPQMPIGQISWITRLSTPARAHATFNVSETQHRHDRDDGNGHRQSRRTQPSATNAISTRTT